MDKYHAGVRELVNTQLPDTLVVTTKEGKKRLSWRAIRWLTVISIHLLFFLSFYLDVQILEGTLNGSRFLGFHLIDPFTTLQVFAAEHVLPINLLIGTLTIILVYLLIGGRTYCAWVCPYGLLSEIGERINQILVTKRIIKERRFDHRVRYAFWVIFLILAATSGYLVFETFNVVGILSRTIVYGWGVALAWVLAVLLVEIFYSRRAWCKYICPIGTTYSFLGWPAATKIEWNDSCDHCMACFAVCPEPHVIEFAKAKYDEERKQKGIRRQYVTNGDCILCGRCIDVCHVDAYKFDFRLKKLI